MKKPQFATLRRSREFRNRDQAEDWATSVAEDLEKQGLSTKKEVDFQERTSRWKAKVFVKSTGRRSVEEF